MRSNFEHALKIVGGAVRARGGLEWDPGETRALVSVSISQKGNKAAGMATSPQPFKKPKKKWELDIKPVPAYGSGPFQPGTAHAIGIVCAMGAEVRVFFWSQEVELK